MKGKTLRLMVMLLAATSAGGVHAAEDSGQVAQLTLEELRTFTDVFEQIRSNYIDEIDDTTLLQAAIHGMVAATDGYSAYIDKDEFSALQANTRGQTGTIGATVMIVQRLLVVESVQVNGPAALAGMRAGDVVTVIDEEPVRGRDLADAIESLEGEPGSKLTLRVLRQDEEPRDVTLTRESMPVASVFDEWIEPGVARLRISHFHQNTGAEFQARLEALKQQEETELKGLVIDLRENLGGDLQSAVDIADGFLDEGLIVNTESRYDSTMLNFNARAGQWVPDLPVAILVDQLTASASEVLTAALQDHHRAFVIGTRTYGKGTIQSILRLRNGSALRLTTARYFTPSGRSLQDDGVEPDVVTEKAGEDEREALAWIRARTRESSG